jgi:hypothetical protein
MAANCINISCSDWLGVSKPFKWIIWPKNWLGLAQMVHQELVSHHNITHWSHIKMTYNLSFTVIVFYWGTKSILRPCPYH